jgi:hypothetical protein
MNYEAEIGEKTLIKCPHCKISMLASSTKPKFVCELVINVEGKLSSVIQLLM